MSLSFLAAAVAFQRGHTLTFVRHGETVANATGKYNSKTLNALSKRGQSQASALTQELLRQPRFDTILVSPAPRAMGTIAPYLRATHTQAVIWPLLYECCTGRRPKDAHATHFGFGARIRIPNEFAGLFRLIPGHDRYPQADKYNEGLCQVDASLSEYKSLYAKGRVLMVGHSGHGGHFIHALTGKWRKVENAIPIDVSSLLH